MQVHGFPLQGSFAGFDTPILHNPGTISGLFIKSECKTAALKPSKPRYSHDPGSCSLSRGVIPALSPRG